jgi:hypothetical protein
MDVVINSDCGLTPQRSVPLASQRDVVLNLLVSLGYNPLDFPFADALRRFHHLEGSWLVLTPAHWQASHNNAIIAAYGKELELSNTESHDWFKLFADYLAVDGIELYYHDASTWLLSAHDKPPLNAKPISQIINQPLMHELAQLDSSMYWQKFFTESQMFFASQPNESALNGVWLWGGAPLIEKDRSICVDEHFMALAQICSSNVTLYNPSVNLKKFKILLMNNLDNLSEHHKEQLKKIPSRWYWNNSAYAVNNYNWFTRLWRNLTHAH